MTSAVTGLRPVATGEVDLCLTGATELRIHGVGGTTPEDLLDHPHPVQVAGNAVSGFFRRWDPDAEQRADPAARHVEGFCWGGLTSGSSRQALWILLAPFLLVNVAHWALPGRASARRWANTAAQRIIRLFALSLTLTLTVAAAETGMDLVGRQCSKSTCFKSPTWLRTVTGYRIVVVVAGALVPVAVITVLGKLGRSTWKLTEAVKPLATGEPADPDEPALADALFWAGAEPVRRLQAIHLGAALAVAAVIQVLPVLDSPRRPLAVATVAAAGVLIALAGVVAASDGVARPHHRHPIETDRSRWSPLVTGAAAAVLVAAVVVDLLPHASAFAPSDGHALARLDLLVQGLLIAQTALIVLLAVFTWTAGLQSTAVQAGRRRPADRLIPVALTVLAWLTAWFFSSGVVERVAAQLFGTANGAIPTVDTIFAALILPSALVVLSGVAVTLFVLNHREMSSQKRLLHDLPPPRGPAEGDQSDDANARTAALAKDRARARALDVAPQLVVAVSAAAVVVAIVGLVLARMHRSVLAHPDVQQLASLGTLALGAGIVALFALAKKAWQTTGTRRSIGILWDLGTFWPRAAHPLAPPCYCERALPQLQKRLASFGDSPKDRILVAGHSQGSVIAAALLLMPRAKNIEVPVALLTYGCPLGRLYGRAFPGYFGPQVLGVGWAGDPRPDNAMTVLSRAASWFNLYRDTDPVGGYVGMPPAGNGLIGPTFAGTDAIQVGPNDVSLVDPVFAESDGDMFPPSPAAHSHYREDATYETAVATLLPRP